MLRQNILRSLALVLISVGLIFVAQGGPKEPKLTEEEILSRHLSSIGTPEVLTDYRTLTLQGTGELQMQMGGTGGVSGQLVFVSDARKSRFSLNFNHLQYSGEQFIYDGDKVGIEFIRNETRTRSALGNFLYRSPELIKNGFWGGTLKRSWTFLNAADRKLRFHYRGLADVQGTKLHDLEVNCRGCDEISVHVYLEPETFRHVRTSYRMILPAAPTELGRGNIIRDGKFVRYTMDEEFSEFQSQDGLTLPTRWLVRYTLDQPERPVALTLEMRLANGLRNTPLDPGLFTVKY